MVPLSEQISCVRRELRLRQQVYPRFVQEKKLTQEWADYQLTCMQAVLMTLEQIQGAQIQAQPDLFTKIASEQPDGD